MADAPASQRIYIDLSGDLFHWGDISLLRKARALGDQLVVGVFSDTDAGRLGRLPVLSLQERVDTVAACRHVDEVIAAAPIAPDTEFLDRHRLDYICLVSDYGIAEREEAFRHFLDKGRGIVLPYTEGIDAAAIVARIVQSREQRDASDSVAPTAAPPAASMVHYLGSAEILERLRSMEERQKMLLEASGAIAGGVFGKPWLLHSKAPDDRSWLSFLRTSLAEHIALGEIPTEDPIRAYPAIGYVRQVTADGDRLVVMGGQSMSVAYALLGEVCPEVTVLRPSLSTGIDRIEPIFGAGTAHGPRLITCGWRDLPHHCPPCDVLAVLGPEYGTFLITQHNLLWHFCERTSDDFIVAVELCNETKNVMRPRADPDRFHVSDVWVRGALHRVSFFEVREITTIVDGVPVNDGTDHRRISRACMRRHLEHGPRFRYLDGKPADMVDAGKDAIIVRWYHASKRSFDPGCP